MRARGHSGLTRWCKFANAPGRSTQSTNLSGARGGAGGKWGGVNGEGDGEGDGGRKGVGGGGGGHGLGEGDCGVTPGGVGGDESGKHKSLHVEDLAQTVLQLAAQRLAIRSSCAYPCGMDQALMSPPTKMDVIATSKSPRVPEHSWAVSTVVPNALARTCSDPSFRTSH